MQPPRDDQRIRIATVQPELRFGNVEANLQLIQPMVQQLVEAGPLDIVVLPEVFDGGEEASDGIRARQFLQSLARECDVHVIGGSCLISEPSGRRRNSCFVVHRSGAEVGRYDKRILFSSETRSRQPGDGPAVCQLDSIRVGVLICADLWHPELARELVGQVDVLAVPAKTAVPAETHVAYARAGWHALALTRALENGFVVAVADWSCSRQDTESIVDGKPAHHTSGASCIIDPSHRPDIGRMQRIVADGRAGTIEAEVDLNALSAFREYRRSVGLIPGRE